MLQPLGYRCSRRFSCANPSGRVRRVLARCSPTAQAQPLGDGNLPRLSKAQSSLGSLDSLLGSDSVSSLGSVDEERVNSVATASGAGETAQPQVAFTQQATAEAARPPVSEPQPQPSTSGERFVFELDAPVELPYTRRAPLAVYGL